MKISKLFHWIYALLMLLPFAFFVPSLFYFAFNDNASMNNVEVPITETISVDFNQLVKNGKPTSSDNWYPYNSTVTFEDTYFNIVTDSAYTGISYRLNNELNLNDIYLVKVGIKNNLNSNLSIRFFSNSYGFGDGSSINVPFNNQFNYIYSRGKVNAPTSYDKFFYIANVEAVTDFDLNSFNIFNLTKMFGSGNEPSIFQFNEWFTNSYYSYNEGELMQITYDTGESQTLASNIDIISNAWDSIWDLPLFNWTKVTFVAVPFTYITGLFGIGANSTLNYAFGYFLSISICWLVFDVLMYVPMLVHRWIDKARIE